MSKFDNLIKEALERNGRDISTIQTKLKEVVEETAVFIESKCPIGTPCRPVAEFVADFVRKNMIKCKAGSSSIPGSTKEIQDLFEIVRAAGRGIEIQGLEVIVRYFSWSGDADNIVDPLNSFKRKYVEIYKGIESLPKIQKIAAKLQTP